MCISYYKRSKTIPRFLPLTLPAHSQKSVLTTLPFPFSSSPNISVFHFHHFFFFLIHFRFSATPPSDNFHPSWTDSPHTPAPHFLVIIFIPIIPLSSLPPYTLIRPSLTRHRATVQYSFFFHMQNISNCELWKEKVKVIQVIEWLGYCNYYNDSI